MNTFLGIPIPEFLFFENKFGVCCERFSLYNLRVYAIIRLLFVVSCLVVQFLSCSTLVIATALYCANLVPLNFWTVYTDTLMLCFFIVEQKR